MRPLTFPLLPFFNSESQQCWRLPLLYTHFLAIPSIRQHLYNYTRVHPCTRCGPILPRLGLRPLTSSPLSTPPLIPTTIQRWWTKRAGVSPSSRNRTERQDEQLYKSFQKLFLVHKRITVAIIFTPIIQTTDNKALSIMRMEHSWN